MKNSVAYIYIIMCTLLLGGCGADQAVKKGDNFWAVGEYYDAAAQYRKAYAQTPSKDRATRGERAQKLAECYRRLNQIIDSFCSSIIYHPSLEYCTAIKEKPPDKITCQTASLKMYLYGNVWESIFNAKLLAKPPHHGFIGVVPLISMRRF